MTIHVYCRAIRRGANNAEAQVIVLVVGVVVVPVVHLAVVGIVVVATAKVIAVVVAVRIPAPQVLLTTYPLIFKIYPAEIQRIFLIYLLGCLSM